MEIYSDFAECEVLIDRMPALWEVIAPLHRVQNDLCISSSRELVRQLEVDLPRSIVVDATGRRFLHASELMRSTPLGRFCTQAVLALPCEWLLIRMGLVVCGSEAPEPMYVSLLDNGSSVSVKKKVGLREWMNGTARGELDIDVHVDGPAKLIAFTFRRS